MESLLVIVTGVSLSLAAGMSIVAWRLLRDVRERAAARIAALTALVDAAEDAEAVPTRPATEGYVGRTGSEVHQSADLELDAEPAFVQRAQQPERPPVPVVPALPAAPQLKSEATSWDLALGSKTSRPHESDSIEMPWSGPGVARDTMFACAEPRKAPTRRWLAVATVGVMMAVGAVSIYGLSSGDWLGAIAEWSEQGSKDAASGSEPLELLSLRHATDETGAFTVTGLVQNPADGSHLRAVSAVVYLFDAQGRYLASGRAALEVSALRPGDESPFVVKISSTAGVSRYRVGFRLDAGGVVAHVDRRGQLPTGTSGDSIDGDHEPGVVSPIATPRRSEG